MPVEVLDLKMRESKGWQELDVTICYSLSMPASIQISDNEIVIFGGTTNCVYYFDVKECTLTPNWFFTIGAIGEYLQKMD